MGVEYVNRRGETYRLMVGKTRTGKPNYYTTKKDRGTRGTPAESIPEGFELYETPADARVYVRRKRETRLMSWEREQAIEATKRISGTSHFFVEIDGDSLVIYWPQQNAAQLERFASIFETTLQRAKQSFIINGHYSPEMRFVLCNEEQRLFRADRMCYRGGSEHWMRISGAEPLEALLEEFVPHLGQESFFEL